MTTMKNASKRFMKSAEDGLDTDSRLKAVSQLPRPSFSPNLPMYPRYWIRSPEPMTPLTEWWAVLSTLVQHLLLGKGTGSTRIFCMRPSRKEVWTSSMPEVSSSCWKSLGSTGRLDDHRADIIDRKLKLSKGGRAQIVTWGTESLTCMINKKFTCIEIFFKAWIDFKTSYYFRPAKMHNNLLHSTIFFNLSILWNPTAKDLKWRQETWSRIPKAWNFLTI